MSDDFSSNKFTERFVKTEEEDTLVDDNVDEQEEISTQIRLEEKCENLYYLLKEYDTENKFMKNINIETLIEWIYPDMKRVY